MRLIFAGTPRFAATALQALLSAGHDIPLVLTQPDRPAGRGLKLLPSDVKTLAVERGLVVAQPATLRPPEPQAMLAAVRADIMIVAAYGLMLPQAVLDLFPHGCVNIHASVLPRWRGAAPIQRAILAGDAQSGVSIMQMEAGLDTGPVLLDATIPIGPRETAGQLHDRLASLGADLAVRCLRELETGIVRTVRQDDSRATYAAKIHRQDTLIPWHSRAVEIDRMVRAFDPAPGAATALRGEGIKIWSAEPGAGSSLAEPGTVIDVGADGVVVACGDGTTLNIRQLQRAGGKRLSVREFLQGFPVGIGERFTMPAAA